MDRINCFLVGKSGICKIHNASLQKHAEATNKEKELDHKHRTERESLFYTRQTAEDKKNAVARSKRLIEDLQKDLAVALQEADEAEEILASKESSARDLAKKLARVQKEKKREEKKADAAKAIIETEDEISSIRRKREALEQQERNLRSFVASKRIAIMRA